jgi:hypothetical protein
VIPGINHASRGIQHQRPLRVPFPARSNFVQRRNLFL